jgi:hypothetical protein
VSDDVLHFFIEFMVIEAFIYFALLDGPVATKNNAANEVKCYITPEEFLVIHYLPSIDLLNILRIHTIMVSPPAMNDVKINVIVFMLPFPPFCVEY